MSDVWGIRNPDVRKRLAPRYVGRQCREKDTFRSVYICSLACAERYMQAQGMMLSAGMLCTVCGKLEET